MRTKSCCHSAGYTQRHTQLDPYDILATYLEHTAIQHCEKRVSTGWQPGHHSVFPRTQTSELIQSSLVLSHNDRLAHSISNGLIETVVLSLHKCDIMWQVFLPFYQAQVDLGM